MDRMFKGINNLNQQQIIMKEEYYIRENSLFEEITKETLNGLYNSDRFIFKMTTYHDHEKHFYQGIRHTDFFGSPMFKWQELPMGVFNFKGITL